MKWSGSSGARGLVLRRDAVDRDRELNTHDALGNTTRDFDRSKVKYRICDPVGCRIYESAESGRSPARKLGQGLPENL